MEKLSWTKSVFFRFYILCENFSKIGLIIKKIPKFSDDPLKLVYTAVAKDFVRSSHWSLHDSIEIEEVTDSHGTYGDVDETLQGCCHNTRSKCLGHPHTKTFICYSQHKKSCVNMTSVWQTNPHSENLKFKVLCGKIEWLWLHPVRKKGVNITCKKQLLSGTVMAYICVGKKFRYKKASQKEESEVYEFTTWDN